MPSLSCDYLVVGAGATAMSFVDELVHASKEITVSFMLKYHVFLVTLHFFVPPLMAKMCIMSN